MIEITPYYLVVALWQIVIQLSGLPLHENHHRLLDKAPDTNCDQDGDENGADGIGNHPVEEVHENGRDDDANAAESVGQDVEENSLHDLRILAVAAMAVSMASMGVAMIVVRVSVPSVTVAVIVAAAVAVTMAGSTVLKDEDSDQVDDESENRHDQQSLVFYL